MNLSPWSMFNPQDWSINDVYDHAAFVYLITFPDSGEYYIGIKQVYKGIKDARNITPDSTQSNWVTYVSSSTTVKEYIENGETYNKQILWCFKTLQEALQVETALIALHGSELNCLNKAIMVKTKIKKSRSTIGVIREILGWLV
ncbi:hypothetical protein SC206_19125 [Rouxiella sp. T17]|uniref:hypothetical protein n=1 Tax=Rouxiella sp. T17 TaxID=3085684 RepID=UPI002FC97A29